MNPKRQKKPVEFRPIYLADMAIDIWKWMCGFYGMEQSLMPPVTVSMKGATAMHKNAIGPSVPAESNICGSLITTWHDNEDKTDTFPIDYKVYIYARKIEKSLRDIWGTSRLPRVIMEVAAAHVIIHEFHHFVSLSKTMRTFIRKPSIKEGKSQAIKYSEWIGGEEDERCNEMAAINTLRYYILRDVPGAGIKRITKNTPAPRLWSPYMQSLRAHNPKFRLAHDAALIFAAVDADFLGRDFVAKENLAEILSDKSTFFADAMSFHIKEARKSKIKWKYSAGI